jgi:hypothetical protein
LPPLLFPLDDDDEDEFPDELPFAELLELSLEDDAPSLDDELELAPLVDELEFPPSELLLSKALLEDFPSDEITGSLLSLPLSPPHA